jgi:hypothetical protein
MPAEEHIPIVILTSQNGRWLKLLAWSRFLTRQMNRFRGGKKELVKLAKEKWGFAGKHSVFPAKPYRFVLAKWFIR